MVILLPIHKMSTTIPFAVLVLAFFLAKKEKPFSNNYGTGVIASLGIYLLIHAISSPFSTYATYAYNDLIIKAPLLVLPFLLSLNRSLTQRFQHIVWKAYMFSCFVVSLFINARVAYSYFTENHLLSNVDLVNYTIIHPSYLSMYLIFTLFILWDRQMIADIRLKLNLQVAISVSILISLIFLGSRIALFTLLYFFAFQLFTKLSWKKAIPLFSILIISAGILVWQTPFLQARFSKAAKMLTASSQEVNEYTVDDRIMIWRNVGELISARPVLGYTSGDYCYHVLKEKHNESGFGKGYRQRLNAHNQFLESQLALGIAGSVSLLTIYFFICRIAIKRKEKLLFHFLIICILFSLVESIFQSQGGVMFFGFFLGLFLQKFQHVRS